MNIEQPYKGQVTIEENFNGLTITNPVKRTYFILAFLIVWFCGWVFGEVFAIKTLFFDSAPNGVNVFMLVWLVAWTAGGAFAFSIIFWQLKGKEIVDFNRGILTLKKEGAIFYKTKSFEINEISKFRFDGSMTTNQSAFGSRNMPPHLIPYK